LDSPGVEVVFDAPENAPIRSRGHLDEALSELVDNAIEHGGRWVLVQVAVPDDGEVRVTVADDGPGIPADERGVFDRGRETALEHASGLGLWLVT
jgi:signal transduction histidine kinase